MYVLERQKVLSVTPDYRHASFDTVYIRRKTRTFFVVLISVF